MEVSFKRGTRFWFPDGLLSNANHLVIFQTVCACLLFYGYMTRSRLTKISIIFDIIFRSPTIQTWIKITGHILFSFSYYPKAEFPATLFFLFCFLFFFLKGFGVPMFLSSWRMAVQALLTSPVEKPESWINHWRNTGEVESRSAMASFPFHALFAPVYESCGKVHTASWIFWFLHLCG